MSARKIFVAGHKGMVGSAICRQLATDGDVEILTASRDEVDLLFCQRCSTGTHRNAASV